MQLSYGGVNARGFFAKIRSKAGIPIITTIFSTALELLANAVRQEKWVRGIRISKKEVKLTVFADDIIVYLEMPSQSMIKLT